MSPISYVCLVIRLYKAADNILCNNNKYPVSLYTHSLIINHCNHSMQPQQFCLQWAIQLYSPPMYFECFSLCSYWRTTCANDTFCDHPFCEVSYLFLEIFLNLLCHILFLWYYSVISFSDHCVVEFLHCDHLPLAQSLHFCLYSWQWYDQILCHVLHWFKVSDAVGDISPCVDITIAFLFLWYHCDNLIKGDTIVTCLVVVTLLHHLLQWQLLWHFLWPRLHTMISHWASVCRCTVGQVFFILRTLCA